MDPRAYQDKGIVDIRGLFRIGKRKVLLWLATGGGKTFVFCRMIKEAAARGKKCIVIVRGRKLVDQASERLVREKVAHGVLMNGHWNNRPHLPIQVCSIDTLLARGIFPDADLIIVDEAHMATSDGFKEFIQNEKYKNSFFVSVTATPYPDKDMRHLVEDEESIVHPITMKELTELGFLVPLKFFGPPKENMPDVSAMRVSRSTNDYDEKQNEEEMSKADLVGSIVEQWKKLANGLPTLCFAVNISHSKFLVRKFKDAGIRAEHCDADTPDEERKEIIKRMERGEIDIICNVGIFCTGVDIPKLRAVILARPTKSLNLHIQQIGRVTRLHPESGKEYGIVLDHAGNVDRLGYPDDEPPPNIFGFKDHFVKKSKRCHDCFIIFRGSHCPDCGKEIADEVEEKILTEDEEKDLVEMKRDEEVWKVFQELKSLAKIEGRKPAWVYYKLTQAFGTERCRHLLPDSFIKKQTASIWKTSRSIAAKGKS